MAKYRSVLILLLVLAVVAVVANNRRHERSSDGVLEDLWESHRLRSRQLSPGKEAWPPRFYALDQWGSPSQLYAKVDGPLDHSGTTMGSFWRFDGQSWIPLGSGTYQQGASSDERWKGARLAIPAEALRRLEYSTTQDVPVDVTFADVPAPKVVEIFRVEGHDWWGSVDSSGVVTGESSGTKQSRQLDGRGLAEMRAKLFGFETTKRCSGGELTKHPDIVLRVVRNPGDAHSWSESFLRDADRENTRYIQQALFGVGSP